MASSRNMSFRSSVQSERKEKGKGYRGGYRDRLDLPKGASTPILLTLGDYEDLRPDKIKNNGGVPPHNVYHTRPKHIIRLNEKSFRDGTCLQGYNGEKDCLACYQVANGNKVVGAAKDAFSLNVIHLVLHHKVPAIDKQTNKIKRYSDDGKNHKRGDEITDWREITAARDLKEARINIEAGLEAGKLALFRKKYLEVGPTHLDHISQIADLCDKRCQCGGDLTPYEFTCSKCGEVLCNVEESNLTVEEVGRYADERQRCSCGYFDRPDKKTVCTECGDSGKALSMFAVVAYVRKKGEGTATAIIVEKIVPITEFQLADGSCLLETYEADDGNVYFKESTDGEPVWREDIAKAMVQFDFDLVHRPLTNEDVANMLKCENPFQKVGTKDYKSYGKKQPTPVMEEVEEGTKQEEAPEPKKKPTPVRHPGMRS